MAKQRALGDGQRLAPATIEEFETLKEQLRCFYEEISTLSKKTPDGKMNKFKLRFINDTLKRATALLGAEYRPFADFEVFVDEELPSASDVVMMLSQYLKSMDRFKTAHTLKEAGGYALIWNTTGGQRIRADGFRDD
jgi:hypothetical protein